jgi:hypothetical protein
MSMSPELRRMVAEVAKRIQTERAERLVNVASAFDALTKRERLEVVLNLIDSLDKDDLMDMTDHAMARVRVVLDIPAEAG